MQRSYILAGTLALVIVLLACPAQAFTAKSLDIAVDQNGDAVITFDYELSLAENFAVFMQIADPAAELRKALEGNFGKPVEVIQANNGRAQFVTRGYATVKERDGTVIVKTPALSFENAEKVLKKYWFAPLVSPDFSPSVTRVSFSDGFSQEYLDQLSIPSISHTLNA